MTDRSRQDLCAEVVKHPGKYRPDFPGWLFENSHVYREFERRALRIAQVRQHYSARTILESIRHDSLIGEVNGEWKVNNNQIPDCARLFAQLNPLHADLFEFREHKAAA
jgi:hypothetical protein